MSRPPRAPSGLVLAAAVLVATACASSTPEASFYFSLDLAPDGWIDRRVLNLAVGTAVTVVVGHTGVPDNQPQFTSVTSSAPKVFEVAGQDGTSRVTIHTHHVGNATLDVVAPDGTTDRLYVGVFQPTVEVLADGYDTTREGSLGVAIPKDESVRLRVRSRAGDRDLVGPGDAEIKLWPDGTGTLAPLHSNNAVDVALTTLGRVQIIGDGGDALRVDVIDPEDVDTLTLGRAWPDGAITPTPPVVMLRPLVTLKSEEPKDGEPPPLVLRRHQLLSHEVQITERSPDVCTARLIGDRVAERGVGLIEVNHTSSGTCVFDVRAFGASFTYSAPYVRVLVPG